MDRRTLILCGGAALAAGCSMLAGERAPAAEMQRERFEAIRATLGPGARIGVAAIDTASGRRLLHDAGSRYAMASTFKLPLAAMVLAEVEPGRLRLDEELPFAPDDPLDNSPVVAANIFRGRLDVGTLAASVVQVSDNSAANALLRRLGGPSGLTRFIRSVGDPVTRLDRFEMELGTNISGDPRDTTTPAAMAELVRTLALGGRLSARSRAQLADWLTTSVPGPDRLRAGLPAGWRWGHKTGTAANGGVNDVGIAWPPGRSPIVIASYQDGGDAPTPVRAAAHAAVARLVAATIG
ncbi:class A beta-lactamase [Allosphingosinicella sp.]|uniref:class A beta-lactamase n=1 Tax=Allosphingosinicella sp. TaxID=2823234 RepID=UPI003D70257A